MPGNGSLRVVVADDSALFRGLLVTALRDAGLEVVGESSDADGVLSLLVAGSVDVAILDVRMPPTHTDEGIKAAQTIRHQYPDVGVLLLSQYVETATAAGLLETCQTAIGYLLKDRVGDVAELVDKIRRVHAGESVLDPDVISRLLAKARKTNPLDRLTPAQREVLALVAEGYSNKAIAERLSISERTVESHVSVVFDVLGLERTPSVHRRVLAAITLLRNAE